MTCGVRDFFSRIFLCRRSYAVKRAYSVSPLLYEDYSTESETVEERSLAETKLEDKRLPNGTASEISNKNKMTSKSKRPSLDTEAGRSEFERELTRRGYRLPDKKVSEAFEENVTNKSNESEITNSNEELKKEEIQTIQNDEQPNNSQSDSKKNKNLKKPVFMSARASKIYIARRSRENLKKLNQQKLTNSDSKSLEDEILQNISCDGNFQKISMHEDSVNETGSSKEESLSNKNSEKPVVRYGNLSKFVREQENISVTDSCDVNDIIPTHENGTDNPTYDKRNLSILENKDYDKRNMSILENKEIGNITTNIANSLKKVANEKSSEEVVSDYIGDKLKVLLEESLETFIKDELITSSSEAEEETEVSCSISFHDRKVFNRLLSKKLYELLIKKISRANKSSKQ